ncbi:hypothetical protein BN2497_13555 [Janthinobacterium sp. CG23_2]|nr:hypothetical protein BN2497_13555 [Janthinobacterium sp. CG23_2]CUU33175.1 hypothetical protein BN3177_13555 [Janthinobacterium sp. CG23_2]
MGSILRERRRARCARGAITVRGREAVAYMQRLLADRIR